MTEKSISDIVIRRLPLYLRTLQYMEQENRYITSSQELGERLGVSAAQIRKDLSQFGEFGKQGTGYNIKYLVEQIEAILQVDKVWKVAVIGAGDIGSALANYSGFAHRGFEISMVFDKDPEKIGTKVSDFEVFDIADLEDKISDAGIKIAMIGVPAKFAQDVTNCLIEAGVKAILNYAPVNINVPPDILVQHIDPSIHLQSMTYYLE